MDEIGVFTAPVINLGSVLILIFGYFDPVLLSKCQHCISLTVLYT